jgi:hypothetical protein
VLTPNEVLRWWTRLAGEVATLPSTLARARRLLVDLPDSIDGLTKELAATHGALDMILPELSKLVGGMDERLANIDNEVAKALGGLDDRLGHMDTVVSELGGTVTGVLGSIPGIRRAVRSAAAGPPPPH